MAARDYQYETSPRKLEPEYEPRKKKASKTTAKKKTNNNKKQSKKQNSKQTQKQKAKELRKTKFLVTLNVMLILAALFAIIWRNSLITQTFAQIQILKSDISELQKENDQLEISIQNNLNLSNIEQEAKEKLGMQKLTSKQTIYLNLPKKDYVEPSSEVIVLEESQGVWKTITNFFKNIF